MNEQHIRDMKPGKDMDLLLGRTLGFTVQWDEEEGQSYMLTDSPFGERWVPFYGSTSWEGMGLVVEEMQRRGWWLFIEQNGDKSFTSRFWNSSKGYWSDSVTLSSAPHAVAMAALLALRGGEQG